MPTHVPDPNFTVDDVVEAVKNAMTALSEDGQEPNTITRSELQAALDCGEAKALRILRQLVRAGKLQGGMVTRTNVIGITTRYGGYRWVGPPAA